MTAALSDWLPAVGSWLMTVAVPGLATAIIASGLLQNAIYLLQLLLAWRALSRQRVDHSGMGLWWQFSDVTMPIAILAPAYNEEATIVDSLHSMLALRYPQFEVIVINDGSRDGTMAALIEGFQLHPVERVYQSLAPHKPIRRLYGSELYPNLLVIDKENGGKADALNAGMVVARSPLVCAVDADSLLESDSLLRCVEPFIEDPERTVAVGGSIRIVNGCTVRAGQVVTVDVPRNLVALFQTVEYLRAFLMGRLAWSEMQALTLISGAFGIFRRDIALAVGGYSTDTVGEDAEIIVKIHRLMRERKRDYRVLFALAPVCWTEAPESLKILRRQRVRWQRGALETFFRHRRMLFNPRYGRIGLLGFGHMLISDVLGPVFEDFGYVLMPLFWYFDMIDTGYLMAFTALVFVFGIFLSVSALVLEELKLARFPSARSLLILAGVAVLENFGYRQLNNLWRIEGWWRYLSGTKGSWGTMTRVGFRK